MVKAQFRLVALGMVVRSDAWPVTRVLLGGVQHREDDAYLGSFVGERGTWPSAEPGLGVGIHRSGRGSRSVLLTLSGSRVLSRETIGVSSGALQPTWRAGRCRTSCAAADRSCAKRTPREPPHGRAFVRSPAMGGCSCRFETWVSDSDAFALQAYAVHTVRRAAERRHGAPAMTAVPAGTPRSRQPPGR